MDELNGVRALVQPSRVVDLTEEEDAVATRMAGQPNTSGFEETPDEGSESSMSAIPPRVSLSNFAILVATVSCFIG